MPPRREATLTGRLLVVLKRPGVREIVQAASAPHATDLTDLQQVERPAFAGLQLLLGRNHARMTRGVHSLTIPEILQLDADAAGGQFAPSRSLLAYWIVDPGRSGEVDLQGLAGALLAEARVIEAVYPQQAVGEPPCALVDNKYATLQFHLDPAPTGIDAKCAWNLNARGQGIGFTDVEMGWIRSHEDLKAKTRSPLLTGKNNPKWEDHGTQAVGLVVATDNDKGVVGIAPKVTTVRLASHWDGESGDNVGDAIATAAAKMSSGDVMLLETQTSGEAPIELAGDFEMDAICAATSKGIIVIEPAGNGGFDLDPDFTGRRDSGAIMVGASVGDPPPAGMGAHARGTSNYGARIHCFAPGAGLVTAGGNDLDAGGGKKTQSYTAAFRDTSGASAVVAGAAILAQSLTVIAQQPRLDAAGMRALLTRTGVQRRAQDGAIGVMPDLAKVASQLFGPVPPPPGNNLMPA